MIDPKASIRPYRKVDMGTELEEHDARLRKLEKLETQVRVFQVLAGMLLLTLIGSWQRACVNVDNTKLEQAGVKQSIEAHAKQPHGVNQDTLDSMQNTDKEHGERLITIEKRLYIRKRK